MGISNLLETVFLATGVWNKTAKIFSDLIGTTAVICLIAIVFEGAKHLAKVRGDYSPKWKAVVLGILGGFFGIFATLSGSAMDNGAIISVRDVGPMFAGCLGGPLAGLISGLSAGLYRLLIELPDVTAGTSIPCTISTLAIGIIAGFLSRFYRKAKHKPLWSLLVGLCLESVHLLFVFFYKWGMDGVESSGQLIGEIALPFLLSNSIGFALMSLSLHMVHQYWKTEEHEKQISTELGVATKIQVDMLPTIFPNFPGRKEFDLSASMTPAKEVGGDFYDFFFVDKDHFAFLIGDVSGKGVPAALFMVISKTVIKNGAMEGLSAADTLTKANKELLEGNKEGMFVTVWLGILGISTGKLDYASAGHNPPLIET